MKVGQRVAVTVYGVVRHGVVVHDGNYIAFVRFDGETKVRWFHHESLSLI